MTIASSTELPLQDPNTSPAGQPYEIARAELSLAV